MKYEILNEQNEVINTIIADLDFVNEHYPNRYREVPEDAPAPEPAKTTLTKLEYMDRFTDTELSGIYAAAKQSVQVEVWLERFKLAESIDLTDVRTIAGVNALEQAGLLAEGRAAEILAP